MQHLRRKVSKYQPEGYNSQKPKIPKKNHEVALGNLLSEIYFLLQSDDYFRHTDFAPPGTDFTGQAPCITKKS